MLYRPSHLTVQWHITDRCNLRCCHCYQDAYTDKGFGLDTLWSMAEQVFAMHSTWGQDGKASSLQFTLTGGEPLAHPDSSQLLNKLAQHSTRPALAILSNGTLIDSSWAKELAGLKLSFVQLSVEGIPATHDAIRGQGSFEQVIRATRLLTKAGVKVLWSFTAHRENWQEFPEVAKLAQCYQVSRLWSDRLIPAGRDNAPMCLDASQTEIYFQTMVRTKQSIEKKRGNPTDISMRRALQFLVGGNRPYECTAGNKLITIMPNGDVYPCRRLPICVGNMLQTPLTDIYTQAPLMQQLRQEQTPQACTGCLYKNTCRGGLRCLAYAVNGDAFSADPGCWHSGK